MLSANREKGEASIAHRFPSISFFVLLVSSQRGDVHLLPVDFSSGPDALGRILRSNPDVYDPNLKTIFLWEGVTYYLSQNNVDATLACIRSLSPRGSLVSFDFLWQSDLEGSVKRWG